MRNYEATGSQIRSPFVNFSVVDRLALRRGNHRGLL
jgi:hypothetical protein